MTIAELDKLVGQPVDIAPWAYLWRADRAVQEKPEAYFIPRRLDRIDKVYRTAATALSPHQLKSSNYANQPDMLKPFPPQPKGRLQTGLLWTGGLHDYKVELHWPAGLEKIPSPEAVEVRVYPTAWGWFGWTVDAILRNPEVSADRRTWTYKSDLTAKMDFSYNARVDAATEMVAVFYDSAKEAGGDAAIPTIRISGPNVGAWKRMDVEIEWGFQPGTENRNFDGRLEPHVAMTGPITPLSDDKETTVGGGSTWQSRAAAEGDAARRGIVVPLLYAPDSRPGLDSRITVRTKAGGFTFRISDLEKGPILIPAYGVFVDEGRQRADRSAVRQGPGGQESGERSPDDRASIARPPRGRN